MEHSRALAVASATDIHIPLLKGLSDLLSSFSYRLLQAHGQACNRFSGLFDHLAEVRTQKGS